MIIAVHGLNRTVLVMELLGLWFQRMEYPLNDKEPNMQQTHQAFLAEEQQNTLRALNMESDIFRKLESF